MRVPSHQPFDPVSLRSSLITAAAERWDLLVDFRKFAGKKVIVYNGTPSYTSPAHGPGRTERGWKETMRMNPGEVTPVIMRFDLPTVPFTVPASPRTGGHEYVWHCHILEHEEHDMMRPRVVK